jgi:hypothetical protein
MVSSASGAIRRALLALVLAALALAMEAGAASAPAARGGPPLRVRIQNVHMIALPGVILEVRSLSGRLAPTRRGAIPIFDDPRSFRIEIDRATTALSTASMSALLNRYTFAYPGAPLRDLALEVKDGKLRQKGILHKGVDVPFEMEGELSVNPDGRLKIHPTSIKVGGVSAKRLLDALGVELVKVIKVREDRGVALAGDDLLLDPHRLLPPPEIAGRVGAVRLEGDRIVIEFTGARPRELEPPVAKSGNYMYFRGARLRFGKLTMQDTDLAIVDAHPDDPFLFYLAEYTRQLVAGYSKTLPNKGLVTYMPDADRVGQPLAPRVP